MKTKRLIAIVSAATAVFVFAVVAAYAASTLVTVTPDNLQGWTPQTTPGATPSPSATPFVAFVANPTPTPPLGTGSVQLGVGSDGGAFAEMRHGGYAGKVLPTPTPTPDPEVGGGIVYTAAVNELSALAYSTYVQQAGSGGQAPYLILDVDYDNDGVRDDLLFFEPVYQDATFCPSNPKPAVAVGAWQTWDALRGCWYSLGGAAGSGPGANVKPLRIIAAANPNAKIVNPPSTGGGLRFLAGGGAGTWDNFIGDVDNFQVGVGEDPDTGPNVTAYDFEQAAVSTPTPTPTPSADLGVTKQTQPSSVAAGRDVVYTIRVINAGPTAATNAAMNDTLPGTMTFVGIDKPADWNCVTPAVGTGGTVTCTTASFASGGDATFTLTGNIPSATPNGTVFNNSATVSSTTFDPSPENNTATAPVTAFSCLGNPLLVEQGATERPSVTTNADAGNGSLRQTIQDACVGATITFNMSQIVSPITLTSGELLLDKSLTLQGPGANLLTVTRGAAAPNFRIFNITSNLVINISGLTVSNGHAPDGADTNIPSGFGGSGQNGGGILNPSGSNLTLAGVAVNGNQAGDGGDNTGATSAGGGGGNGGGISNNGTLTLNGSTVSGNKAGNGGTGTVVGGAGGHGGGIFNHGTLTLTSSTVSGNLGGDGAVNSSGGWGGGIYTDISLTLTSSTITANRTGTGGGATGGNGGGNGGGIHKASGTANIGNTIVGGNTVASGGVSPDLGGTYNSQGYNLIQNTSGATINEPQNPGTNITGVSPQLAALADNGGPTRTHRPRPDSPAIDKGNAFGLTADQRGLTRPVDLNDASFANASGGDGSDIGAVEVNYAISATAGTPQSAFPDTNFATPLQATLTESGLPVAGITVTFSAPASGASGTFPSGNTAVTDANGRASVVFKANATPGSYSVTANITPALVPAATFSLTNLAPGRIQFGSASYQQGESGGTAVINVTRTGGSDGAASVNFSATAGTATGGASCVPGVDFVNVSGTLNWADGDASEKTFSVTVCEDSSNEPDETVNLALSGLAGQATFGAQTTSTLTITDNDPRGGVVDFSAALYAVAERGGQRSVTVVRTGDTTRAASVDYATDDGSIPSVFVPCSATTGAALARCDYTHAAGTLQFAAGETSKTFVVPVNDDSFVEGQETTRLVLSNPGGGAALGAGASATLQIDDDAAESAGNPIDDDRNFVRQQYHDFLNREPDTTGWDFWTNGITSCGADAGCREVKRIDTSAAFFLSIEFQQTGYFVYLTRKASYGDIPGTPIPVRVREFLSDTQTIGRGVVVGQGAWEQQLEANRQAYLLAFVQSQVFRARYPDSTSAAVFVNSLDANAGGVLTQGEKDDLTRELSPNPSDASLRASVLRKVASNQTLSQRETNRAFVLMQYFGYLRRDPDAAPDTNFDGYNFWLAKLNQFGGDYRRAEMVKAFLSSAEYRNRFGPQ
jgi:uncharacterized repeat protein (TIGR01451 family)